MLHRRRFAPQLGVLLSPLGVSAVGLVPPSLVATLQGVSPPAVGTPGVLCVTFGHAIRPYARLARTLASIDFDKYLQR